MPFIGNQPAKVPLTSADITDNVITSAKIVDGTITNTDVASSIITGQTAETSIAGGDSLLIYDDSASALRKMTRTNFIGGGNTPSFFVYFTTGIALTQDTNTLVKFDTETFDTDNAYSTSTGKFIVPSGKAGKYFFSATVGMANNFGYVQTFIYKNGTEVVRGISVRNDMSSGGVYGVLDLAVGDEIQIYCNQDQATNNTTTGSSTTFSGFKLI